jgi:predicted TIM-barrel fold metal-dependent hydrolase
MKTKVICLEEHFWTPELSLHMRQGGIPLEGPEVAERLNDLGELRLREMDEAGIDVQVISHAAPATQWLDPVTAVALARDANDQLHRAIIVHPDRFAGFAILPTPDPSAAAAELERGVTVLGFKGAMIHGLTHGEFIDAKKYWPIFKRAQELNVPIYIHPALPHPDVYAAYYKDYPIMARAGWGFGVEAATQAIRLVLSGLFDEYPQLKIILGHLGEGLPYSLWRCDAVLSRALTKRRFREYFCEHFYITTSGNFSHPALLCCAMEMGVDRILFSIDWPYASNVEGRAFVETAPLARPDKDKILSSNAATLLKF